MAKVKDLRIQTTTPATPSAGVVSFYADSSGVLNSVNADGTVRTPGTFFVNSRTSTSVSSTGNVALLGGAGIAVTGHFFGVTGSYPLASILAEPNIWIPVVISGTNYAVPAYTRSS
jgi:hypothetical protein